MSGKGEFLFHSNDLPDSHRQPWRRIWVGYPTFEQAYELHT